MAPKPLEGADFRNPQLTGPRKTHSIPDGGLFSIYAETHINTPPQPVYDTLLAVRQYKDWNPFITNVTITKHPHSHDPVLVLTQGTFMTFTLSITPTETQTNRIVCQYLEKLRHRHDGTQRAASYDRKPDPADPNSSPRLPTTRIRWTSDNANLFTPRFVLHSVWTHEIEEQADGTTIYRTWNVYSGMGAKFVRKKLEGPLRERFQEWAASLKRRVEEGGEEVARNGTRGAKVDAKVEERDALTGEAVKERERRKEEAAAVGV